MSKTSKPEFKIDLNLIEQDENGAVASAASGTAMPVPNQSHDLNQQTYIQEMPTMANGPTDATPIYFDNGQQYILGDMTPSFVYDTNLTPSFATPTFLTTPNYLTVPSVGYGTPNMFGTPCYGTPYYAPPNPQPEPPAFRYPQHHKPQHVAVSCRVHNVVKRVRAFFLKNGVDLIKVVDGPNVLKVSVRSILHTQKLEGALMDIMKNDEIKVKEASLPESIDVTKRKRGFLLFLKLEDFSNEKLVRKRFAETGLDYKITIVDGLTHASPKMEVEDLVKQVQKLQMEVEKLKKGGADLSNEKTATTEKVLVTEA